MSDLPRPKQHLVAAGQLYPHAWKQVDQLRADRGESVPDWPTWCFVPIAATASIVADDAGIDVTLLPVLYPDRIGDAARLAALAAWRVTQGIYRYDETMFECVASTPLERDLPCDVLYRMPEWCVYIETPGLRWGDSELHGFWGHLEHDVSTGRPELRLLLDSEASLPSIILHLGQWSLLEALERAYREGMAQAAGSVFSPIAQELAGAEGQIGRLKQDLAPLVSLLLYLCSQSAEVGTESARPGFPSPKRTKKGLRMFPADRPTTWDVGVRLGAAIRQAREAPSDQAERVTEGGRARPTPHVRKAHWHPYWTGPRAPERAAERVMKVHWLPPIPVNVDDYESLPATIKPVLE